ncbi:MAG: Eco57I restriction-modification methylase domain-containing protein [Promethearchaeota archaeon]
MNHNHEILKTEEAFKRLINRFKDLIKKKDAEIFKYQSRTWKLSLNEQKYNLDQNYITPKTLEKIFESIEKKKINKSGIVFTPSWITDSMVDFTLDRRIFFKLKRKFSDIYNFLSFDDIFCKFFNLGENNNNETKTAFIERLGYIFNTILNQTQILDPCVGGGAFIVSLLWKICSIFIIYYPIIIENKTDEIYKNFCRNNLIQADNTLFHKDLIKEYLMSYKETIRYEILSKICNFIEKNIFFVDLNKYSLELTEIRVKALLITIFSPDYSEKIDEIRFNSFVGDVLYNLQDNFPSKFGIILGNPPYISSDKIKGNISLKKINELKEIHSGVILKGSKPDLYFYFLEKGVQLLENEGLLSFIIPNRILSNNYALKLREFLLTKSSIQLILDFNTKLQIFPGSNVHPCIITFLIKNKKKNVNEKKDKKEKNDIFVEKYYLASKIGTELDIRNFNINEIKKFKIAHEIAKKYKIFFTNISDDSQALLNVLNKFQKLGEVIKIHEGTRIAHFQNRMQSSFSISSIRISAQKWIELREFEKSQYVGEVRGKDIHRYFIGKNQNYIALPELINRTDKSIKKEKLISELSKPTLFIRELGKKIHAGIKISPFPMIGYGGVYFFNEKDIIIGNISEKIPKNGILFAFLAYFSSDVFLWIYRTLFSAGSWGNALKFRSTYFYQLPLISFDFELFAVFGEILNILQRLENKISNKKIKTVINWVEKQISICLCGSIIINSGKKIKNNLSYENFRGYLEILISYFSELQQDIEITIQIEKPNEILNLLYKKIHIINLDKNYINTTKKIKQHPFYKTLFDTSNSLKQEFDAD